MRLFQRPKGPFRPGARQLSATDLNALADGPNQIVGSYPIQVAQFGDRMTISQAGNQIIPSSQLQTFMIVDETDDWLVCRIFNYGVNPQVYTPSVDSTVGIVPPGADVLVAKPWTLQRTPWDGNSVDLNGDTVTYSYTAKNVRLRTDSTGQAVEVVDPPYFVGDIIVAKIGPTGYFGTPPLSGSESSPGSGADDPIMWMDINLAAREWEAPTGEAGSGESPIPGGQCVLLQCKQYVSDIFCNNGNMIKDIKYEVYAPNSGGFVICDCNCAGDCSESGSESGSGDSGSGGGGGTITRTAIGAWRGVNPTGTFSTDPFTVTGAGRLIVIVGITSGVTPTGVTLSSGGSPAEDKAIDNTNYLGIWSAVVTAGASGPVTVTFPGTSDDVYIEVVWIQGLPHNLVDTGGGTASGSISAPLISGSSSTTPTYVQAAFILSDPASGFPHWSGFTAGQILTDPDISQIMTEGYEINGPAGLYLATLSNEGGTSFWVAVVCGYK